MCNRAPLLPFMGTYSQDGYVEMATYASKEKERARGVDGVGEVHPIDSKDATKGVMSERALK